MIMMFQEQPISMLIVDDSEDDAYLLYSEMAARGVKVVPRRVDTARDMIAEVRGIKALSGYRGKRKGDLEALARAIVALSRLALSDEPVAEAEINPLIVLPENDGVVAVDALVKTY